METQDRDEDAGLPRDIDPKPRASTRYWLVGTTLTVVVLAAMLYTFSPGSFHDALEPASWAPPAAEPARDRRAPAVEPPKPQPTPQHVVSIESEALALTVERPTGGDAGTPAVVAVSSAPLRSANPNARTHVVVRGDTLWDIAKKYVGNPSRYPELRELSGIRDPDLIYPGDIVRIEIRDNRK